METNVEHMHQRKDAADLQRSETEAFDDYLLGALCEKVSREALDKAIDVALKCVADVRQMRASA